MAVQPIAQTISGPARRARRPARPHPRAMIEMHPRANGTVMHIRILGKLTKADYEAIIPEIERIIGDGDSLRLVIELHDFQGWSAGAIWEDVRCETQSFGAIERLAIIGDSRWQKGLAMFCIPFINADIRFFNPLHHTEANAWAYEGLNWF